MQAGPRLGPMNGTVRQHNDRLLTLSSYGETRPIPISEVGRIEMRGRDRGRWATFGLFLGAVGGAAAYRLVEGSDEYTSLVSLFVAAPVGALMGATAGAMFAPEEWVTFHSLRCQ